MEEQGVESGTPTSAIPIADRQSSRLKGRAASPIELSDGDDETTEEDDSPKHKLRQAKRTELNWGKLAAAAAESKADFDEWDDGKNGDVYGNTISKSAKIRAFCGNIAATAFVPTKDGCLVAILKSKEWRLWANLLIFDVFTRYGVDMKFPGNEVFDEMSLANMHRWMKRWGCMPFPFACIKRIPGSEDHHERGNLHDQGGAVEWHQSIASWTSLS